MNERIKELALQAENYAAEQNDKFGVSYKRTYNEKFAELLIRECMGIISNESEKISNEWRCKDGKHIWWKIKEHFGVKE